MLYKYYWSVFGSEESLQSTPQQGCSTAGSQRGTLLLAAFPDTLSALLVLSRDPQRDRKNPEEVDRIFICVLLSAFACHCSTGAKTIE